MSRCSAMAVVLLLSLILGSITGLSWASDYEFDTQVQADPRGALGAGFVVLQHIPASAVLSPPGDTAREESRQPPAEPIDYNFMVHHGAPLEEQGDNAIQYRRFQRKSDIHVDDVDSYVARGPDDDLTAQTYTMRVHDALVEDRAGASVHRIETLQRDLLMERPLIVLRI